MSSDSQTPLQLTHAAFGGRGPTLIAVEWTELAIGTLLVALRTIYARKQSNGRLRWDWLWVLVAWTFAFVGAITSLIAATQGLGNHKDNLDKQQIKSSLLGLYLTLYIGLGGMAVSKLSIVALLLDVLSVQAPKAKKRRWGLWAVGVINLIVTLIMIGLSVGACSPVSKAWDISLSGTCSRMNVAAKFGNFQAAVGALADFTLALWPITIVWNLKVSIKTKICTCLLMGLGILPGIASIIRVAIVPNDMKNVPDPTYQMAPVIIWGATELWLIIILGSLPPLRPLFMRLVYGKKVSFAMDSDEAAGPGVAPPMTEKSGNITPRTPTTPRYIPVIIDEAGSEEYVLSPADDPFPSRRSSRRESSALHPGPRSVSARRGSFDADASPIVIEKGAFDNEARAWRGSL